MIKARKAMVSNLKNLIIVLIIIVIVIAGGSKLYSRAKDNIKSDFDPNKFYNNNQDGKDVIASTLAKKLEANQLQGASDVKLNIFANQYSKNTEEKGQLVLFSSVDYSNGFFAEQRGMDPEDKISLKLQQVGNNVMIYLSQEPTDGVEIKSIFADYETDAYLKNKNLCFIPKEVVGPLLTDLTTFPSRYSYPSGVFYSNVPKKYALDSITIRPFNANDGSSVLALAVDYSSADDSELQYLQNQGALVAWIYNNNICFFEVDGFGLFLDDKNILTFPDILRKDRPGFLSPSLVTAWTTGEGSIIKTV